MLPSHEASHAVHTIKIRLTIPYGVCNMRMGGLCKGVELAEGEPVINVSYFVSNK